jgi:16S rRNA (guanine527-N7)-methyltransferase
LLLEVLEEARQLGFLGPGPVLDHYHHAVAMAKAAGSPPDRLADLGSGGGVPALVLLELWPGCRALLVEAAQRRAHFLRAASERLGWAQDRVILREARAEEVARDAAFRGMFPLVTARSFGAPAVTAECAAPFLRRGGRLLVSEPPAPDGDRWPVEPLAELGLRPHPALEWDGFHFRSLEQAAACPARYPRRTGVPARRPLF